VGGVQNRVRRGNTTRGKIEGIGGRGRKRRPRRLRKEIKKNPMKKPVRKNTGDWGPVRPNNEENEKKWRRDKVRTHSLRTLCIGGRRWGWKTNRERKNQTYPIPL